LLEKNFCIKFTLLGIM